jgi:hypothetical protein
MFAGKCKNVLEATPLHFHRSAVLCGWILGIFTGCTAPGTSLMESPLSIDEQQQAVLEVAPRGTFRDDAARRLKAAGIEFTVGGTESIFYVSLWNRPNGERWHMNVALLFDPAGNLYQTRTADSTTSLATDDELADSQARRSRANSPGIPARRITPADGDDDGPERVAFPGQNGAARNGTR